MPLLAQVLEAFPDMYFNIDAKEPGVEGPLLDVIADHRAAGPRPGAPPPKGPPAGEADLADPEPLDANAHEAHNLVVRQGFLGGQPVQAFGRHAVGTAQVAAIGERHAQVSGHAPEGVDEPQRRVTRHRICRLGGGNELDRHGATLPRFARYSPLEKPSRNGNTRPLPRR